MKATTIAAVPAVRRIVLALTAAAAILRVMPAAEYVAAHLMRAVTTSAAISVRPVIPRWALAVRRAGQRAAGRINSAKTQLLVFAETAGRVHIPVRSSEIPHVVRIGMIVARMASAATRSPRSNSPTAHVAAKMQEVRIVGIEPTDAVLLDSH